MTGAWQAFHAPLLAFVVALVLALLARRLRSTVVAALAGGAGVAAGWFVAIHPTLSGMPRGGLDRLALLSIAMMVIAVAAERFAARRGIWPPLLISSAAAAWWLAGAPRTVAAVTAVWPVLLGVALTIVAVVRLSGSPGTGQALQAVMAGLTLAAALRVAGAPWVWIVAALTPAVAALPLRTISRWSALSLLAVLVDLASLQAAVCLSLGRLTHGRIGALDVAALSPLLALWMFPHALPRVQRAGRAGPLLAALICGAFSLGVVWAAMRLLPR